MEKCPIRPLHDNVLVEPIAEETLKYGSLELVAGPKTLTKEKGRPHKGRVVAVGPGRVNEKTGVRLPMDVSIGDEVCYGRYDSTQIRYDDKDFFVVSEQNLMGVLE